MNCPKCSASLPDDAKFCGECGSPVSAPTSAPADPLSDPFPPPEPYADQVGTTSTGRKLAMAFGALAVLVGGYFTFDYFRAERSDAREVCSCFLEANEKAKSDKAKAFDRCDKDHKSTIKKYVEKDSGLPKGEEGRRFFESYGSCMQKDDAVGDEAGEMCDCMVDNFDEDDDRQKKMEKECKSKGKALDSAAKGDLYNQIVAREVIGGCVAGNKRMLRKARDEHEKNKR